jgi:hypothetical protein
MIDLYINELSDHFKIYDLKIKCTDVHPPLLIEETTINKLRSEDMAGKILDLIKEVDIIIAIIEDDTYHYSETFSEIGMAVVLNKPVVIFEMISVCGEQVDGVDHEGVIPRVKHKGNISISTLPLYWAKNIVRVSSWPEMRAVLNKIEKFVSMIEAQSDSDE